MAKIQRQRLFLNCVENLMDLVTNQHNYSIDEKLQILIDINCKVIKIDVSWTVSELFGNVMVLVLQK